MGAKAAGRTPRPRHPMIRKHSIGAEIGKPAGTVYPPWGRRCLALLLTLVLARSATAAAPSATSVEGGRQRPRLYQDRVYVRVQPRDAADVTRIWNLAEDVVSPHDPAT